MRTTLRGGRLSAAASTEAPARALHHYQRSRDALFCLCVEVHEEQHEEREEEDDEQERAGRARVSK